MTDKNDEQSADNIDLPEQNPDAQVSSKEEADQTDTTFKWYVVRVASSRENSVVTSLQERAKLANMESYFEEILVPTEEITEMKSGKKRNIKRKFFPGYILVKMNLTDESWHFTRNIPNVLGFLSSSQNKPLPISDKEAKAIADKLAGKGSKPKPSDVFEAGEVVRIVDGPFADFNGVVEEVNYEKCRLVVAVLIFGRSTPVDLEFSQVEKGS